VNQSWGQVTSESAVEEGDSSTIFATASLYSQSE
jgi:hypothetical protein